MLINDRALLTFCFFSQHRHGNVRSKKAQEMKEGPAEVRGAQHYTLYMQSERMRGSLRFYDRLNQDSFFKIRMKSEAWWVQIADNILNQRPEMGGKKSFIDSNYKVLVVKKCACSLNTINAISIIKCISYSC